MSEVRGSDKLRAAWRSRALSEDTVNEVAKAFDGSPAIVENVELHGGGEPSGMSVTLRYDGDDMAWCGNDIQFWLKWHLSHGGVVKPPRFIINGTPYPEWLRMRLDFGHVETVGPFEQPGLERPGFERQLG
jgi:hypothetical protein